MIINLLTRISTRKIFSQTRCLKGRKKVNKAIARALKQGIVGMKKHLEAIGRKIGLRYQQPRQFLHSSFYGFWGSISTATE